jgi:hypothetical protein
MEKNIPTELIRKRHKFLLPAGGVYETHKSVSQAKRRSRALQASGCKVTVDRSDDYPTLAPQPFAFTVARRLERSQERAPQPRARREPGDDPLARALLSIPARVAIASARGKRR